MQDGLASDSNVVAYLEESLTGDTGNLSSLRRTLDLARIEALAGRLYKARRIVLLGGDLSAVVVNFLQYNLAVIDLPAVACTRPGEVVHAVRGLRRADLVIGITFRRGLRQTVEGLRQARARGAYCVALTDTHLSPLARFAQECFVTPVEGTLYGVSYVAPMAFLNMVLVACAGTKKARTIRLMKAADAEQRTGFRWYRDGEVPASPPSRVSRRH